MKIAIFMILPLLLSGCIYNNLSEKAKDNITYRHFTTTQSNSIAEALAAVSSPSSIGDVMFYVTKVETTDTKSESYAYVSTIKNNPFFPEKARWSSSYIYKDEINNKNYRIYTTPRYFDGAIGVILDENFKPATEKPLIQVQGGKKGRSWELEPIADTNQPFFRVVEKQSTRIVPPVWGLRYGGFFSGKYTFEIVNKSESSSIEVLQSIEMPAKNFMAGFTIRGVRVKGVTPDSQGVITFDAKLID